MIWTLLFYLLSYIVTGFFTLLSSINVTIPSQINTALTGVFSYVRIFDGIFPASDVLLAVLFILTIYYYKFLFKTIFFIYSFIPIIGKNAIFFRNGIFGAPRRNRHDK